MNQIRFGNRRSRSLAAIIVLAAFAGVAQHLAAQEIAVSPSLANQLRYLKVGLVAGRVTASGTFSGRSFDSSTQSPERREKLTVDLTSPAPSIDYELSTTGFRIVLEMNDGDTLRIERTPQGA